MAGLFDCIKYAASLPVALVAGAASELEETLTGKKETKEKTKTYHEVEYEDDARFNRLEEKLDDMKKDLQHKMNSLNAKMDR